MRNGFTLQSPEYLWALNDPLRPQTVAAGRKFVAKAVLSVFISQFAAAAEGAGRKFVPLHFVAVTLMIRRFPQLTQRLVGYVADDVLV